MDGCDAPLRVHCAVWHQRTASEPIQSIHRGGLHLAWRFDPRFPQTQSTAAPPGTQFTTFVRYRALEAGPRTFKITTDNYEFTGGLKGNLGEFGAVSYTHLTLPT